MAQKQKKGVLVAVIAMMFLFAMISFVTNMAAPFGNIWKNDYEWAGMMGNMMNFSAYLFMGIPAGVLITKIGYKKQHLLHLLWVLWEFVYNSFQAQWVPKQRFSGD